MKLLSSAFQRQGKPLFTLVRPQIHMKDRYILRTMTSDCQLHRIVGAIASFQSSERNPQRYPKKPRSDPRTLLSSSRGPVNHLRLIHDRETNLRLLRLYCAGEFLERVRNILDVGNETQRWQPDLVARSLGGRREYDGWIDATKGYWWIRYDQGRRKKYARW